MYHHPNNHVGIGEEAAAAATCPLPSPNPTNNNSIPTSWSTNGNYLDTSPVSSTDLSSVPHSTNDSLASSPPPLLSPFNPSPKRERTPSKLPPTNPFSSAYKPPVYTSTPPPRPTNSHYINPFPSPEATPTPPPRAARNSELLSARIASHEARTAEAAARASARATARAGVLTAVKCVTGGTAEVSPFPDEAAGSSSATPSSGHFYDAVAQKSLATPCRSVNEPDHSHKPHDAPNKILSRQHPTIETSSPSLDKGKGRRSSSVSSQLSLIADYYVAATDKFPTLPSDGASQANCSEQVPRAPGHIRRRSGMVLSEFEEEVVKGSENERAVEDEDEDEDEEDLDPSSPRLLPISYFQIGGANDLTSFAGAASSNGQKNSRGGRADPRFSVQSFTPSVLDLTDAQREDEARSFWEDTQAELDQIMLAANENDPTYARVNTDFSSSTIPPREKHSEPTVFSEREPDREKVFQVFLGGYPKYEVSNVFYDSIDQTRRMNEEARRRATCIDDPDAKSTPHTCPVYEDLKLPLHKRLSNMLPSPGNFTPSVAPGLFTFGTWNYRPRDCSLQAIEMASTAPGLELKDEALRARAEQYSENREVLEGALKEDRVLRGVPTVFHALECPRCHSVRASGSLPDGFQHRADVETLRSLVLEQYELRQDIERLEATARGLQTSFSTLASLPIRHRYGNAKQRQLLADRIEQGRRERRRLALAHHVEEEEGQEGRTGADEELSSAPINDSCPLDQELDRALDALDPIVEPLLDTPGTDTATANLAAGESFPFVDQARPPRPATRRSSSVYSERPARSKSGTTTPHTMLEDSESTNGENVSTLLQPDAQDRAAAYNIMKSVQTYHDSGRRSRS